MKNQSDFRIYQKRALEDMLDKPFFLAVLGMGLGKTITTLTAIQTLLQWQEVRKVLIVAPRLVTEKVWTDEATEWSHVSNVRLIRLIGTPSQRLKALSKPADVWLISRDNVAWLVNTCKNLWPFDMVVLDESTSFKSPDSLRFKKMKEIQKLEGYSRMIQLTGTPAPNGLLDLWAPVFLLDGGKRLEKTFTGFKVRYFNYNEYTRQYELRPGAEEAIYAAIADISISMSAADWLTLPPRIDVTRKVALPNMAEYKKFERDSVLALPEGEITAMNAAVLYGKLLQFCNGAIYDADKNYHIVQDLKLEALCEEVEALAGQPVIIFYSFQSDIARIQARIPDAVKLTGPREIDDWNAGKIRVLVAHPASTGHGLNLQHGGHNMIWYGLPSSLELYLQAVARLDRQGQKRNVVNKHLITEGTVEELVSARLIAKDLTQKKLIEALKAEITGRAPVYEEDAHWLL